MSSLQILLIDDNPAVANALELAFRVDGHSLVAAPSPEQAYSLLARKHFDAILLDLNYSAGNSDGGEGLACLAQLLSDDPAACIVVLTAHGGMRIAVAAMQAGARDFVVKPWNNAELIEKVVAAVSRPPIANSEGSGSGGGYRPPPQRLLGNSAQIAKLREMIRRVGPTQAGVAITGPSGSGRTLAANLIHNASALCDTRPFTVDLRSETAGQLLDDAKGTVILRHADQLGEVEQEQLIARLPDSIRPIAILSSVDALIPSLRRRIATLDLRMPSLAEREEDAILLARHFAEDAAARFSRPLSELTEWSLEPLRAAGWPDEVRGLALAVERAVLLSDDDGVIDQIAVGSVELEPPITPESEEAPIFNLDRVEKALIEKALSEYNHNVSHAARALGLSRGALYRRMERHGL